MKRENSKKALSILLVALISLSAIPLLTVTIRAATEAQIDNAIAIGVEWLAVDQETDGSWPSFWEDVATTGLAVLKLEHRAYELGYASPFDPSYKYHGNVTAGLDYLFSKLFTVEITLQDHTAGATGTVDDPDFRDNGLGVYAHGYSYPFDVYDTGIVLSAISASGTPDRMVSVTGSSVDGWKYSEVAQDMVDWLAWAQADSGLGEGGWEYKATNNGTGKYPDDPNAKSSYGPDNSNSGYAVLGLGYAQNFGCTVPQWVKTELNTYIGNIQDPVNSDTNDGGSWYTAYSTDIGVNILKTGNLIFEMALVGDTPTTTRVVDALNYLARHWGDASGANSPPGWDGNPAQYQAMFCAMKGLEYMGVDTFDSIDWYADFSDKIVAQQTTTPGPNYGSWQQSSGRGNPTIITAWALLTLEKTAPPHRNVDKKVYVELLRNGDFSNGLTHWMVRVENGASVQTHDGPTWLSIRPLGPGWTDVNLVNEPGRTNVLDIVQTVSDGDGDWTGAYQTLNRDVSGFSELYFEADGKAMFQSLAGDGWVGGEYPVHFIIQYKDVNGIQHDTWLGWPANPAWQQGFYYLAGNLPNEPYSNLVTQNVWFHYKSPNLMNLSPAPKTIKTVRLYSSGWAYQGRIDNAQLYGTPPSASLGDVIHNKIEVTVPPDETVTVVDTLPRMVAYITGTFTVDGVPATPTITKVGTPPNHVTEISYTITDPGTHVIQFKVKADEAKNWEDTEVCNIATATWYDEAGVAIETKEDVECFTIHPFEELHKNVGIPKADVVFAIDLSGSMSTELGVIQTQAPTIINNIASQIADVQFGLITFVDYAGTYTTTSTVPGAVPTTYTATYGSAASGDYPYKLDQNIGSAAGVIAQIGTLTTKDGWDWPQDYSRILHEAWNDANLHWRTGAARFLILFGDAQPHDTGFDYDNNGIPNNTGGDPGRDTVLGTADDLDFETEVANAATAGIHVMGVYSGGTSMKEPWTYMAAQTGGQFFWLTSAGQIPDAIHDIVKAEAQETLVIKEKTNVQWAVVIDVVNTFPYTMTNVNITDRFGAEIEIDPPFPYSITHGTATYCTNGNSEKVFLTWNIGDLLPGETARLIILVSTDTNPGQGDCNKDGQVNVHDAILLSRYFGTSTCPHADFDENGVVNILDALTLVAHYGETCTGKQEYTEPGIYELNSGATLKFIDPEQNMQFSAYTDSIYVTVLPEDDC